MCARLRAWVGDLAGFELLPWIYRRRHGGEDALCLTGGSESGRGKCQGELAFDPRDLVA